MPGNKKRIVIIGATSSIAEHCARLWGEEAACSLVLVGRDLEKTNRIAADLRVRNSASEIETLEANFIDPLTIRRTVDDIVARQAIDIVLIAHGSLPDQETCQQDLSVAHDALLLNGISPVLFAEAFAGHMQKAGHGSLAIIGSVAGDRGRKSNYVYGAAKGLVARYIQGLQHRLAATNVKVIIVKPGPTDTPMTAHLKQKGVRLARVEEVAGLINAAINQGNPVVYAPAKWRSIMMIIIHLPSFVFNHMNI